MIYKVRINKRIKNIRVYAILKKTTGNVNAMTKLFMKIFERGKKEKY